MICDLTVRGRGGPEKITGPPLRVAYCPSCRFLFIFLINGKRDFNFTDDKSTSKSYLNTNFSLYKPESMIEHFVIEIHVSPHSDLVTYLHTLILTPVSPLPPQEVALGQVRVQPNGTQKLSELIIDEVQIKN